MGQIKRPPAYKIAVVQFALTGSLALIFLLHSMVSGYSALLGGLICAVPNGYFIWKAFQHSGARSIHLVLKNMYQGEGWKLGLTAIFFGAVFLKVEPLNLFALFFSFIVVQLAGVFATSLIKL